MLGKANFSFYHLTRQEKTEPEIKTTQVKHQHLKNEISLSLKNKIEYRNT